MKTSLPAQSNLHQEPIQEIADIILKAGKDKIAFIILFGSFARGSWIRYRYIESDIVYEYASDYDFLVITKSGKQANGGAAFDMERKIKKEIDNATAVKKTHRVHIIIESINRVNEELEKSQYFFSSIKEEGIMLYNSGEYQLSEADGLNREQRIKIAKDTYQHWFQSADGFLIDYENALSRNDHKKSALYLHQATESLYNCTLLTLGGYKPKSHDLEELNQLCVIYSEDFLTLFPKASLQQKECFALLQKAYIGSRYNKDFQVTKEQLEYLFSQIRKLQALVRKICEERIS